MEDVIILIPAFLKEYRKDRQYLLLGMRLTRDTERMVLSDMIYAAAEPKGWALIPQPSKKEQRFCSRLGIEIIEADYTELMSADNAGHAVAEADAQMVGC